MIQLNDQLELLDLDDIDQIDIQNCIYIIFDIVIDLNPYRHSIYGDIHACIVAIYVCDRLTLAPSASQPVCTNPNDQSNNP